MNTFHQYLQNVLDMDGMEKNDLLPFALNDITDLINMLNYWFEVTSRPVVNVGLTLHTDRP